MSEWREEVRAERKALTAQQRSALAANLLEVRKKCREAREAHSKRLVLGVALVIGSSQELATGAHVEVRGALKSLVDGRHVFDGAESPEKAFASVRDSAGKAFSESPTDAEILANSATPDLVRYLLSALRAYDGMPANLATAFKAKGQTKGTGSTTEVWRLRKVFLDAARETLASKKRAGVTGAALEQAVEDAAYEKFVAEKRHKIRPDTEGERKLRSEIRGYLNEYFGWGWKGYK